MKIGLLRCMQTEDACPSTACFRAVKDKSGAFEGVEEDIEIVGMTTCGGCPGKRATFRAKQMAQRGADTIVLASCIGKGTPIGFPCPFAKKMEDNIAANIPGIRIIGFSH